MTLEEICSEVRDFIVTPSVDPQRFDTLARRLFSFQFRHNAAYRSYCLARHVTPDNLTTVQDIPSIVTSAFKDLDLTTFPPHLRAATFHSSGTTAHRPSRHFHSADTLRVYEQSLLQWFQPHLNPAKERFNLLVLAPRAADAPHSSLVHMFESVAAQFGAARMFAATVAPDGSWLLDFNQVSTAAKSFSQQGLPVLLCGTAFSFVHLCDHLAGRDCTLSFPRGSRALETGGYKGRSRTVPKSELHAMISARLSIPRTHIITEYGMSELSSQAYDRTIGAGAFETRTFQFPPWARACVISPDTSREVPDGETGLLRMLDLANVGSVCAIQTEDLAIRRGHGFELVGRAAEVEPRGCSLMEVRS